MNELFDKMLDFVLSKTMREYLTEQHSSGNFNPSAEDMLAIAYNCPYKSFEERYSFISLLAPYISDKESFALIENAFRLVLSDFSQNGLHLHTCIDIYSDDEEILEPINTTELDFFSVDEAVAYIANSDQRSLCCKLCHGSKTLLDKLYIDKDGIWDFKTTRCNENYTLWHNELNAADRMLNKYVYIPNPFSPGDIVYVADTPNEKYVIINAIPDEYNSDLDYIDTLIMAVPYEYREHATPEKIALHYQHLYEARSKGESIQLDTISLQHEHLSPLELELLHEQA